MELSERASRYLGALTKDKAYVFTDREAVIHYLTNQNIQPFESIVDFQVKFSGFHLTITSHPDSTFHARLFSKQDIEQDRQIEVLDVDGQSYFYCGDHTTAQFWFVLCANGQIGTYNNRTDTVNIIFSSFEKWIETYAIEDFLEQTNLHQAQRHHLIDENGFEQLTQHFLRHESANDDYNQWLSLEELFVQKGTWLDSASYFIRVYAKDIDQHETFVKQLKESKIIS